MRWTRLFPTRLYLISFCGLRFADTIRTRQLAFAASELRCIVTGAQTSVEGSPSVPIAVCHPHGQHTLCKKGFPIAPEKFRMVVRNKHHHGGQYPHIGSAAATVRKPTVALSIPDIEQPYPGEI
jgi:hypothetical protein